MEKQTACFIHCVSRAKRKTILWYRLSVSFRNFYQKAKDSENRLQSQNGSRNWKSNQFWLIGYSSIYVSFRPLFCCCCSCHCIVGYLTAVPPLSCLTGTKTLSLTLRRCLNWCLTKHHSLCELFTNCLRTVLALKFWMQNICKNIYCWAFLVRPSFTSGKLDAWLASRAFYAYNNNSNTTNNNRKQTCTALIFHIEWKHKALYNSASNTYTPTYAQTHTHAHLHAHTHTHTHTTHGRQKEKRLWKS